MAFAALVLTARWLGPYGRGLIGTATSWATLFGTVGYLSLGQVAIHFSMQRHPSTWLPSMLGTLGRLTFLFSAAGWFVAVALSLTTGGAAFEPLDFPLVILTFVLFPLLLWEQYGSALLVARGRIDIYNRAQVIGRTTSLVLITLLLVAGVGTVGVMCGIIVGQCIVSLTGLRFLVKDAGSTIRYDATLAGQLISRGLRLHANAVGAVIVVSADVLLLSHFRGATEAGQYQVTVQLLLLILFIPQAASTVMMAQVAQLGPNDAWLIQRRILLGIGTVIIAISLAGFFVAEPMIELFFGQAYEKSGPLLQILLCSTLGAASASLLTSQWIGRGYFTLVAVIAIITGVANIAANLLVIPDHGMYGSAWILLGTSIVALCCNLGMVLHCERRRMARAPVEMAGSTTTGVA